jgi:hypothetical protein
MSRPVLSDADHGGTARILALPTPTTSTEPATKGYVDSAVEGLAWKDSVRVRTASNINLASPGASLDGVAMAANDRVLVAGQTLPEANGIYVWSGAATPMTRAADANTAAELEQAITTVEEGTSAGGTYRQTAVNFTLDTGAVAWTAFGTSAGAASETTAGIAELATQAETDTGTDDLRIVTPLKLATWSGRPRKFQSTIGDGAATQYDVTHNFGTRDVQVQVWETSGSFRRVDAGLEISAPTSANAVRLNFASAPASGAYRVVILA